MLGLSLAQALSGPPAGANDLARVRKALAEPPPLVAPLSTPAREGLVFRATVYGRNPDRPIWEEWSSVPSYIRPKMPLYHYQFMQQVTPQESRAGTFATAGFPVGEFIEWLAKGFAAENRKAHQSRARAEVRKALEEVLACRADPWRPGC